MLINETLEKKVIYKAAARHRILGHVVSVLPGCFFRQETNSLLSLKKRGKKNELTKQHRFVIYLLCQG